MGSNSVTDYSEAALFDLQIESFDYDTKLNQDLIDLEQYSKKLLGYPMSVHTG
jgi:hypothetical protein